ncbi:MAG: hypothetical protein C0458_10560 [Methylobacterium sp.]|nr:hypothetical protein [Methylobacterium sp.]
MNIASNDNLRTPEQHRAAVAAWAATAPIMDGKIFPRAATSKAPRHAALADRCRPILRWKALWEAAEADVVQSSWMAGAGLVDDDRDDDGEDQQAGPSVEGVSRDWLPNKTAAIRRQLDKLLTGVETAEKTESLVRRIDPAEAEALRAEGRNIKTAVIDGQERAIEIVETRSRVVIVGGKVAKSTFSGRLIRAGDIKFADGLRGADAENDNLDIELDDAEEEAVEDDEAGLVAVDRFHNGSPDTPQGEDAEDDDAEAPVHADEGYNNGVRAGSVIGQFKRFRNGGKTVEIVVPMHSKLEFTERKSAPPPARETLSPDSIDDARHELAYLCDLLCEETVTILNNYRARKFEEIGQLLGAVEKTAERRGRDIFPIVCDELRVAVETYAALQDAHSDIREAA